MVSSGSKLTRSGSGRKRAPLQRPIAWYLRQLSRLMNVLSDDELERLIPLLSERKLDSREFLFSAGEAPDRVYLLLKGRVKVYQVAENGKEIILDVAEKGDVVGDMAIVEDGERIASAQALDEAVAASISWEDFSHLLHQSPRLAFAMAELMAGRLAGMQRSFMNMASKPVSARIAEALLDRGVDGSIELGLTHQEFAQTLATSRETVTALLSRFVTMGCVAPKSSGFMLTDEQLLRDIANGEVSVSSRHPVPTPQRAAAT